MSAVIEFAALATRDMRQIQVAAAALTFRADEPRTMHRTIMTARHRIVVGHGDDAVGDREAYFLAEAMAPPQDFEAVDALVLVNEVL